MCGMKEEFISSSIAHKTPQEAERLEGYNNYFQKKAERDKRVKRPTTTKGRQTIYPSTPGGNKTTTVILLTSPYLQPAVPFLHPSTGHPIALGLGSGGQGLYCIMPGISCCYLFFYKPTQGTINSGNSSIFEQENFCY